MLRYFFILLFFPFILLAQPAIPEHGGRWVHDEAHVLSPQTIQILESVLKADRDSTSNQIAVLTIPSLENGDINDYAVKVFEKWKLGQKDKDNGVLFVIVPQEKKFRIEVGVGLEGVLTDAMSSRILRNEVAPFFRQGNWDGGIQSGVSAIIRVIKGEYKNDEPHLHQKKRSPLLLLLIIFVVIFLISRGKRGGGGGGFTSGGMFFPPMGGFGSSHGYSSGGGGFSFGGGGISGGGGASGSW